VGPWRCHGAAIIIVVNIVALAAVGVALACLLMRDD
jgi:hypothetical protein